MKNRLEMWIFVSWCGLICLCAIFWAAKRKDCVLIEPHESAFVEIDVYCVELEPGIAEITQNTSNWPI